MGFSMFLVMSMFDGLIPVDHLFFWANFPSIFAEWNLKNYLSMPDCF
jgi:hypothetical protein